MVTALVAMAELVVEPMVGAESAVEPAAAFVFVVVLDSTVQAMGSLMVTVEAFRTLVVQIRARVEVELAPI